MNATEQAQSRIKHGNEFPYDAPDDWWNADVVIPPAPATDWAHLAARGIIADLEDRRGIKNELHNIDEEIRVDIVQSIAAIIREAQSIAKLETRRASRPEAADSVGARDSSKEDSGEKDA